MTPGCCGNPDSACDCATIVCPDCESHICSDVKLQVDDILSCPECGAELLITGISPELTFKVIEEEK